MSSVDVGEIIVPESEEDSILRQKFGEPTTVDGEPKCFAPNRSDTKRRNGNSVDDNFCMLGAGRGTSHKGYGPCDLHGGDTDVSAIAITENVDSRDAIVIKNDRLKQLFDQEMNSGSIDNMDSNIALISAMIKMTAEGFGMVYDTDAEGMIETDNPNVLRSQSLEMAALIRQKSAIIKDKHQVMQIAGETIPRSLVRSYALQMQLAVAKILRDTCPHCHKVHNMRTDVLAELNDLGGL